MAKLRDLTPSRPMPRYKLRTLLILLAVLPPFLAVGHWQWSKYKARQARREYLKLLLEIEPTGGGVSSIVGGVAESKP